MIRKLAVATATLLAILVVGVFVRGPGYKRKAKSFFIQMQETTTAAQLQSWALEEIDRGGDDDLELVTPPAFLDTPDDGSPNYIYVDSANSEPHLIAQWGSGFGHWGLLVGDPSLNYPIDDYYHIEWAPGVFVWHEIQ